MPLKRALYICNIIFILVFTRCAQVAPLNGGSQDIVPPKLLKALPANASINFSVTLVELQFDEFVQVLDMVNQVVITPQTKELPSIEARGKKIIVKFTEPLLPNTTYRLYFGNSVADMHERNVLSNFEYIFSTGNIIDSLRLKGKVENAFNLKPEKDITIGLYDLNEADSVAFHKKPMYFTRTALDGSYKINYLPKSKFKAFAFSDKNKNQVYDGGEEQIAFKEGLIETPADSIINFKLFKEESNKKFIKKSYSLLYGQAYIIYNKELLNKVTPLIKEQKDKIKSDNSKNDTCVVYFHDVFDTLKLLVSHASVGETDTLSIPILSKEKFEKQQKEKKLILSMDLEPVENGKIAFYNKPRLIFNKWMDFTKVDTSKIRFTSKEDTVFKALPELTELGINKISINNKLQENGEYQYLFNKGAFKDKNGIESDSLLFKFKISSKEDYSNLNLKLILPQKENYIVQIVNNQGIVIAEQYLESSIAASSEKLLKFIYIVPGECFVKVIEDKNKNKIWDTGNLILQKHAETIYFNTQSIKLLADWESEIEWKVSEN